MRALHAGRLDIALLSRPFKAKERSPDIQALFDARTPLVFAVHENSPLGHISVQDLVGVYAGTQRSKDGVELRPILRPASDSDVLMVAQHLPQMTKAFDAAYRRIGIPIATTDQMAADKLETVPGAIGTTTLAVMRAEQRSLKPLALNGVDASVANLAEGRYPLAKDLYLAMQCAAKPELKAFLEFVASPTAIELLRATVHQVIPFETPRP